MLYSWHADSKVTEASQEWAFTRIDSRLLLAMIGKLEKFLTLAKVPKALVEIANRKLLGLDEVITKLYKVL